MFWIATDLDFMPRSWFLSTPAKSPLYESFIHEAIARIKGRQAGTSIFSIAGPGMIADVLFARRSLSDEAGGYTNYFGEANLLEHVTPQYKKELAVGNV